MTDIDMRQNDYLLAETKADDALRHRARLYVCGKAADVDDARELLAALGLLS